MNRNIILLIAGLLFSLMVRSQTSETLTNSSVIKMSKAKLSDELIIETIKTSPSSFDMSSAALKILEDENVPRAVIEAMKKEEMRPPSVEALNYVTPLTELIRFNETEFDSFTQEINNLDKEVQGLKSEVARSEEELLQAEDLLITRINSDTKPFNDDIKSLSESLKKSQEKYVKSKSVMAEGGKSIIKKVGELKNEKLRLLSKAYGDASQKVGSSTADPVAGENRVAVNLKTLPAGTVFTREIIYANEIPVWHLNEITVLKETISDWNPKVEKVLVEDSRLIKQLDPLIARLEELKTNSKQNKSEIAALKKEISRIEKERKKLSDQMKGDRKELSSFLRQLNEKNLKSISDRFTDIIENITYSFEEKLSL